MVVMEICFVVLFIIFSPLIMYFCILAFYFVYFYLVLDAKCLREIKETRFIMLHNEICDIKTNWHIIKEFDLNNKWYIFINLLLIYTIK